MKSTGLLTNPTKFAGLWVHAQVVSTSQIAQPAAVAIQESSFIGKSLGYTGRFAWGAFAGGNDGAVEAAGDITISVIPVIGVYSDVRDVAIELGKFWPGGESPDDLVLALAALGILAEATVGFDYVTDVAKQFAKFAASNVIKKGGALYRAVEALVRETINTGSLTNINECKWLLLECVGDPQAARNLDVVFSAGNGGADGLRKIGKKADIMGHDEFMAQFANMSDAVRMKFGRMYSGMSDADFTAFLDADGVEIFQKGFTSGNWRTEHVGEFLDAIKTGRMSTQTRELLKEFAEVSGSGTLLRDLKIPFASQQNAGKMVLEYAKSIKNAGESVVEFGRKVKVTIDGKVLETDADILTATRFIEIKAGKMENLESADSLRQVRKLRAGADLLGKTPSYVIDPRMGSITENLENRLDHYGIELLPFQSFIRQ